MNFTCFLRIVNWLYFARLESPNSSAILWKVDIIKKQIFELTVYEGYAIHDQSAGRPPYDPVIRSFLSRVLVSLILWWLKVDGKSPNLIIRLFCTVWDAGQVFPPMSTWSDPRRGHIPILICPENIFYKASTGGLELCCYFGIMLLLFFVITLQIGIMLLFFQK